MSNIVVVAEARGGKVKRPSLEAVGAAVELATSASAKVVVVVVGNDLAPAVEELKTSGAHRVVAIESPAFTNYSGDGYAKALMEVIPGLDAAAILMPHSAMGKDLMPRVAALLGAGMVSDAIALHFEGGRFGATKPVYAGKAYQKAMADKSPFLATLRPNNFEAKPGSGSAEVETKAPSFGADQLAAIVTEVVAAAGDRVPLQEAKVVVAGGRGLKAPEHFHLVEDLAKAFGPGKAAVGASRAVVDAGWRPHREQVGQTGKVVAPTLYIAAGISGAIQHLAGMRTARCIVAINKDPEAPIFKVADYGIVGDVFEVLPALTKAIEAATKH
ncbi:MAG: electron transfer flavoprotein subunit alpha/FixB family protein [Planctomycetota bacterium]